MVNLPTSARGVRDMGSIPGSGSSPEGEGGNPFQYSCLENSMDGGAWWTTVHGVAKSQTRLSDFTSLQSLVAQTVKNLPAIQETRFHPWVRKIPLQKGMATHSSILAWRIPWTEESGGLQSMGLQRV